MGIVDVCGKEETDEGMAMVYFLTLDWARALKRKYREMGFKVMEDKSRVTRKDTPYDLNKMSEEDLNNRTAILVYLRGEDPAKMHVGMILTGLAPVPGYERPVPKNYFQ